MRSCIYCGRELEKGEVCNCPQSAAFRAAKAKQTENTQKSEDNTSWQNTTKTTSYQTGYTKKESSARKAWERGKAKWHAAKSEKKAAADGKAFAKGFSRVLLDCIKSPVSAIEGAHSIGKATMLLIAALLGMVLWLCAYFIIANVHTGPLSMLASLMSFNGTAGYMNLLNILMVAVSGAISGIILFFVYTGIFFLINKYIFKTNTGYWDFSQRLSLAGIPLLVVGVIGIAFSMISSTTLLILLLCGGVGWVVLTYEALKAEWYSKSPDKIAYAELLGLFVFFTIVCWLIRIGS